MFIYRTILASLLIVLPLIFTGPAHACIEAPIYYPWIPRYDMYSKKFTEERFADYDFIGLVTAEFEDVGNNPQAKIAEYAHIRFDLVESLRGRSAQKFYLIDPSYLYLLKEYPETRKSKPAKKAIVRNPKALTDPQEILKYEHTVSVAKLRAGSILGYSEDFDFHSNAQFKDLMDISRPQQKRKYQGGLCGNEVEQTVVEGLTYLVFKKGQEITFLEPINPQKDSLVDWVKSKLADQENDYLKTTFKDFFKPRNGYGIIEITACPSDEEVLENLETKLPFLSGGKTLERLRNTRHMKRNFRHAQMHVLLGTLNNADVTTADIENYFRFAVKNDLQCKVGDLYFTIGRDENWDENSVYKGFRSQDARYNWRFMRIEDQQIVISDLVSNLVFSGPDRIHLSELFD